jgi:hypothetical protein
MQEDGWTSPTLNTLLLARVSFAEGLRPSVSLANQAPPPSFL